MLSFRSFIMSSLGLAVLAGAPVFAQQKLHFTYLWHLEQPIYWPDQQATGADRYQRALESYYARNAGAAHPENNLADIFGLDDRKAVYQYRVRDSINAIRWASEAGAQISYSGGLIENVSSLGSANQLGYGPGWFNTFREARNWSTATANAKPRLDIVVFPFHHALMPLLDESAQRKEIQLYQSMYPDAWGTTPGVSKGFFPSEMAFSTRMIPVLAAEGITWSIVSAEKISRAYTDFPVTLGSGGVNTDPPNRADQLNGVGGTYYRVSISRGCAPAEAVPGGLTPRRAQYIDPATGAVSSIIVVPASQSLGWKDGYAPLGLGDFNALQALASPARPMLIVLAHDGDNAWGGGYSYYLEATPNLVSAANGAGYVPTMVEQYLTDHPVPTSDVVHVEDGAWVNADGDFGAPQFINWNWPLVNAQGQIDVENGWAEDARNWAVITAAQNAVDTAEAITRARTPAQGGTGGAELDLRKILYPDGATRPAERAWHYFLGALNSGYMYYGTSLDMEVKPTVACNEALEHALPVISGAGAAADTVAPTVWIPQRHPWNPGSLNFGPQHGYRQVYNNGDFWVWSFVHDVGGIPTGGVVLKYRLDADGQNPLSSTQNETYAGGSEVGAWQSVTMTKRAFPAGNFFNDPSINFFEMPGAIADQYHAKIVGVRSQLVDYYIEAIDARGNLRRSSIQHVWVGDGTGAPGGGGGTVVTLNPASLVAGQSVTITYDAAGRGLQNANQVKIHLGYNNWNSVVSPDAAMTPTPDPTDKKYTITVSIPSTASQIDMVFNDGASTWDNNGGQDWHFAVSGAQAGWAIDGQRDAGSVEIATNADLSLRLWAGLRGDELYVATTAASAGNDRFVLLALPPGPGPLTNSPWGKAGQAAGWSAFIGNEVDSNWNGWFDAAAGAGAASASGGLGGTLEGKINLAVENGGALPDRVYLAVASYPTANATNLIPSLVVPAKASGTTLLASDYREVRLCELTGGCCPADFNGDGFVDDGDFVVFAGAYDAFTVPPADGDCDLNGDGFVDDADFVAFAGAYDAFTCP